MRALAIALAALAASCGIPEHGPTMEAGRDCLECHGSGGEPSFTVAGTAFWNVADDAGSGVQGARVQLTDARGRTVTVRSNQSGNFYTRERLQFPLLAIVQKGGLVAIMSDAVPQGGCSACHGQPPRAAAGLAAPPGRVALLGGAGDEFMLPGFDCQACHRVGGTAAAKPWSASGTVFATRPGDVPAELVTVTIDDAQGRSFVATTNRVGNFFLSEGIAFGTAARVQISKDGVTRRMDEELPHGSCNGCHRPGGEGEHRVSLAGDD
jgi:hypothetical protein